MSTATTPSFCTDYALGGAKLYPGFCAGKLPVPVGRTRSILATGPSSFLTVSRSNSAVWSCFDTAQDDGVPEDCKVLASKGGLNHGLAFDETYLYASRDTEVYRWEFTPDSNKTAVQDPDNPVIVVNNINANGNGGAPEGHTTRTLILDDIGRLYIAVGSDENVDPNSFRSRIRRFVLNENEFPYDFTKGEVFMDGLRNEVGLAFDSTGVLWGVENSADRLKRTDLGGDITNDNPADELNRFPEELLGAHFGYPYCWSEYNLPNEYSKGQGSVWAWPDFLGEYSDEQCRSEYVPSEMALQAHSAPLGLTFYKYQENRTAECDGVLPFPQEMDGYVFMAYHGSWNRDVPTGYKVNFVPMENGRIKEGIKDPIDLLEHNGPQARWDDGFRPVDVSFDGCGRLLVTSDGSRQTGNGGGYKGDKIVRIEATEAMLQDAPKEDPPEDNRLTCPKEQLCERVWEIYNVLDHYLMYKNGIRGRCRQRCVGRLFVPFYRIFLRWDCGVCE